MPHAPPAAKLALAFTCGACWGLIGAPIWSAPLVAMVWLVAPDRTSRRPKKGLWIFVALLGAGAGSGGDGPGTCESPVAGTRSTLVGRFLAAPRTGSAPFATICGTFTVVTSDSTLAAGRRMRLEGRWMPGRRTPWLRSSGAAQKPVSDEGAHERVVWAAVRWRDELVARAYRLYEARAPLVTALTLARREGMARESSEVFARTGIAHLLAISGFHVGVVAGIAGALLRATRFRRRRAGVLAAGVAWLYVALIGFPSAACRAALILALVAVSRLTGRPPARWGALAAALLLLVAVDPVELTSPGFQLSFAGAAGLVAWARPVTAAVQLRLGRRCPRAFASAVGAGVAATLATLPVVAWHFERVSLVGIPVTLVATPLVALALPGAIVSLLLEPFTSAGAAFLAGGVDVLLATLEAIAGRASDWRWASAWTSRSAVIAALTGLALALMLARNPRVHERGRKALAGLYVAIGLVAWPLGASLGGWGRLEIVVIDVGQGDAIALRSPRGRWLLVDAGPPLRSERQPDAGGGSRSARLDEGGHPAVRALASRGVTRIEALVLTHPDLDHIGGAPAVLRSFDVRSVHDPALPAGKAEYSAVLDVASEAGIPWIAARAGHTLDFDGASIEVLHPTDPLDSGGESNEASVVLMVRFGDFDVLLTGDAYKATERRLVDRVADLEVLKLGHHGSDTSTDSLLLESAGPQLAIGSLGRFNRYGHPDPAVLARLERAEVPLLRTDLVGTISVTGRADGTFSVRSERGGRWRPGGRHRGR